MGTQIVILIAEFLTTVTLVFLVPLALLELVEKTYDLFKSISVYRRFDDFHLARITDIWKHNHCFENDKTKETVYINSEKCVIVYPDASVIEVNIFLSDMFRKRFYEKVKNI